MGVLLLKSLVYGIIEGVTEWLPVSSTGHLILLEDILTLQVGTQVHPLFASEFWELFLVTVQLGAIFCSFDDLSYAAACAAFQARNNKVCRWLVVARDRGLHSRRHCGSGG